MKALEILEVYMYDLLACKKAQILSKHGEDNLNNIKEAIAELEALQEPKTCDGCKHFFQRFTEDGYLKYNICDKGVNSCYDKFFCAHYQPKDS